MTAWLLSIMLFLEPAPPWKASYEETAKAIVDGAKQVPLFDGPMAVERTIALDASLAWFESRFNPNAIGDHGKSRGLYQVQYIGPDEGVTAQTVRANRMMLQSFKICSKRPLEERLAWYASGGNGCDREGGIRASKHRMLKAFWLFRKFPTNQI